MGRRRETEPGLRHAGGWIGGPWWGWGSPVGLGVPGGARGDPRARRFGARPLCKRRVPAAAQLQEDAAAAEQRLRCVFWGCGRRSRPFTAAPGPRSAPCPLPVHRELSGERPAGPGSARSRPFVYQPGITRVSARRLPAPPPAPRRRRKGARGGAVCSGCRCLDPASLPVPPSPAAPAPPMRIRAGIWR